MANNLYISYDLRFPERNYERAIEAIQSLGHWARISESFWYVCSSKSALEALAAVSDACDANDTVCVIDVTNGHSTWTNVAPEIEKAIHDYWNK